MQLILVDMTGDSKAVTPNKPRKERRWMLLLMKQWISKKHWSITLSFQGSNCRSDSSVCFQNAAIKVRIGIEWADPLRHQGARVYGEMKSCASFPKRQEAVSSLRSTVDAGVLKVRACGYPCVKSVCSPSCSNMHKPRKRNKACSTTLTRAPNRPDVKNN